MRLVTEILQFFSIDWQLPRDEKTKSLRSVGELLTFLEDRQGVAGGDVLRIVMKLKNEALLFSLGSAKLRSNVVSERLVSVKLPQSEVDYGAFDFQIEGFGLVASHFKNSVVPIVVKKPNGDLDIGTGFIVSDGMVLTARHVIENMERIRIRDSKGNWAIGSTVVWPKDSRKDMACINFKDKPFIDIPKLRIRDHQVLEDVLLIGYPPLPGFDAFQIYEQATINNAYKLSKGHVIGEQQSYFDSLDYFVINAKVKGGNSGGPVINKRGYVVGMVVQIPADSEDRQKLDALGYGIAIPTSDLRLFWNQKANKDQLESFSIANHSDGFELIVNRK